MESSHSSATNLPKINFKRNHESLTEGSFYTIYYCIKRSTTDNMLTVKVNDMWSAYGKNENCIICLIHGLVKERQKDCEHCTLFTSFKYAFVIHTGFSYYTFPPPVIYTLKNINYYKTFCRHATDNLYVESVNMKIDVRKIEANYYHKFMNMDFQGGPLKGIASGKTSFLRNKILAYQTKGIRATLTIDCSLSPHYVILPQKIYDSLSLAVPLIIINRAPSIRNECIYAVEPCRNKNVNDYTIRINPYLTEGLHADQDGDELTIFYIEHTDELPSMEMTLAITELKKLSWKYGNRHDISYASRFQFTQYHKYILYTYDDYFCKINKLWASLEGEPIIKARQIMELGCSTHFNEVDEFITQLSEFTQRLPPLLTSVNDVLNGTGDIESVVKSGAKGSTNHIIEYLKNIFEDNKDNKKNLIASFNKNITSSTTMSAAGGYQFQLLSTVNPLTLHGDFIYYNSTILLKNVKSAASMAGYYYNTASVLYAMKGVNTIGKNILNISEDEVLETMKEYL